MAVDQPDPVSLSIKTVPADQDVVAARIARQLEKHLRATGVETELVTVRYDELMHDVLLDHNFEIFIGRFPEYHDPDFLRPVLHSRFSNESGWQNPFDFTDLDIDELLIDQRGQRGPQRQETVTRLQNQIARTQPFTVIAIPNEIRAVRTDRFDGYGHFPVRNPVAFAALTAVDADVEQLRLGTTDSTVTENLNPISVRQYRQDTVLELLYDSLARRFDGAVRPWLARDWNVVETTAGSIVTVELRDNLKWHDGSQLTVEDVAFTYRFLQDTSRGENETPVPALRFRDRSSLVQSVTVADSRTVRLFAAETSPQVAKRMLTVPILPESEWGERTGSGDLSGVSASTPLTEALVWENGSPVGNGLFEFDSRTEGDSIRLTRFDQHALHREQSALREQFGGGVPFRNLRLEVTPSDETTVALLAAGELDATLSKIHPSVVPDIEAESGVELRVDTTSSFYMIGYNTHQSPLGNPRFRRIVARLLDKEFVVDELLEGYGTPAASPLAGTDWLPVELEWDGTDPEVPFFGDNGEIEAQFAREAFKNAGFRYGAEDQLLQR
jgi:peptide/nickel transport system substrate-binding protein